MQKIKSLSSFLNLAPHEQKKFLFGIVERSEIIPLEKWNDALDVPSAPGYYAVIATYGRYHNVKKRTVMRWNGSCWADCYDNEKTTSGRYTAWNPILWVEA